VRISILTQTLPTNPCSGSAHGRCLSPPGKLILFHITSHVRDHEFVGGLGLVGTAMQHRRCREASISVGRSERTCRCSLDAHLCTFPVSATSRRSSDNLRALHCHLHVGDLHLTSKPGVSRIHLHFKILSLVVMFGFT
jgi:hypothetical protein